MKDQKISKKLALFLVLSTSLILALAYGLTHIGGGTKDFDRFDYL